MLQNENISWNKIDDQGDIYLNAVVNYKSLVEIKNRCCR